MNRVSATWILLIALLLSFGSGKLMAQLANVRPGDLNPQLDSLFTSGQISQLEVEALRMLHSGHDVSKRERIAAHLYLGFSWVLTDREEDAKSAFLQALDLEPSLDLDEVYVPPRLYEAFQQAREDFFAGRDRFMAPTTELGRLPHYQLGTGLNFIIPGSGFIASGKHLRGTIWTAAFLGTAGYFAYSYIKADQAREDYLTEANPFEIEERYDDYDFWYKRAMLFGFIGGAIYVGAQLDYQLMQIEVEAEPTIIGASDSAVPGISLTLRL